MRIAKAAMMVALGALALAACDQRPATTVAEAPVSTEAAAVSASEAYVGTWAVNAADCNIPQDQQGAPYVFHSDGFDQHEAHCTWANVQHVSPTVWRIAAACEVEGDEASLGWDISVNGDTMEMDPGGALVRCPAS